MLAGSNFTENFNSDFLVESLRNMLKQYPQLFLLENLSITSTSNQFVGKVQGVLFFEESKDTLQSKKITLSGVSKNRCS